MDWFWSPGVQVCRRCRDSRFYWWNIRENPPNIYHNHLFDFEVKGFTYCKYSEFEPEMFLKDRISSWCLCSDPDHQSHCGLTAAHSGHLLFRCAHWLLINDGEQLGSFCHSRSEWGRPLVKTGDEGHTWVTLSPSWLPADWSHLLGQKFCPVWTLFTFLCCLFFFLTQETLTWLNINVSAGVQRSSWTRTPSEPTCLLREYVVYMICARFCLL